MFIEGAALHQFLASHIEGGEHDVSFTTNVSPGEAMGVWEQVLFEAGWKVEVGWELVEDWRPGVCGGFIDTHTVQRRTYRKERAVLAISVTGTSETASIQLSTRSKDDPRISMSQRFMMSNSHLPLFIEQVVPSLWTSPRTSLVLRDGSNISGSGTTYYYSSIVTLDTEMAFADLVQTYEKQIVQQGWQGLARHHDDESALSAWQLSKHNIESVARLGIILNPMQNGKYMLWLDVHGQSPAGWADS